MKVRLIRHGGAPLFLGVSALVRAMICFCMSPAIAQIDLERPIEFKIAPQPLDRALLELSSQADIPIAVDVDSAKCFRAPAVVGQLHLSTAISRLLADTGLTYRTVSNIVAVGRAAPSPAAAITMSNETAVAASAVDEAEGNDPGVSSAGRGSNPGLQEVVVTAQKREERLQDVPVPVSAIAADTLVENAQLRFQDYYSSMPGLNLTTDYRGSAQLSIRGLTTGAGSGNPTVAVTVDDVPFGSSSSYGGSGQPIPDLDPGDLARVEVLRGPQGTLYGASSIGGLIKYVTADPSTSAVSGHVAADVNHVSDGDGPGYALRGAANVPFGDTIAVRGGVFGRHDAGYIDNVVSGVRGVNEVNAYGGHFSALWHPMDNFSAKLSSLFQSTRGDGTPAADLPLKDLKQSDIPDTGQFLIRTQSHSLTLSSKLGPVDLTSVTGYNAFRLTENSDLTPALGGISELGFQVSGAAFAQDVATDKFSQELRATLPLSSYLDWLVGAFYTHEHSRVYQNWYAAEPKTGLIAGNTLLGYWVTSYEEYSGFTDLTFHLTERIDLQIGGRESKNSQNYFEVDGGNYSPILLGSPGPVVNPNVVTDDSSFTYLGTLQYEFSKDLMAYLRLASGYRAGGPNQDCLAFNVPCQFAPDKTRNYELGVKGRIIDHTLTFDASIYRIDWKKIQLSYLGQGGAFYTNGGGALSEGVEASLQSMPVGGLTLQFSGAYNRAVLAQTLTGPTSPIVADDGDRMPNSARWTGNASAQQEFPLSNALSGFVGASVSYVGDRIGGFSGGDGARELFPSYVQVDSRTGVSWSHNRVILYARNLTDRRGVLGGGIGALTPGYFFIEPRKVGLSVSKSF